MNTDQKSSHTVIMILLGLVSLKEPLFTAAQQGCANSDPCRCTLTDGSGVIDISSIGNMDGTPRFPDAKMYDGQVYSYNPCFAFSQGGCKDAAVCKKVSEGTYTDGGQQKSALWMATSFYPFITYTSSTGSKSEVMLICDTSYVNPQLDAIGVYSGIASFNLWSKCACAGACKRVDPPSDSGGLSGGSIMIIIFFVILFVYLVAGLIFSYVRTNTFSKETLPNFTFWSAVPGLIAEGFRFSWGVICRRDGSYTPMK